MSFVPSSLRICSTGATTDASGGNAQRQTYYPYGTVRTTDGLPTDYTFTE